MNSSEDCLFVNIARPSTQSSDPEGYPVAIWIYGGGFASGSSQLYHTFEANNRIVSRGIIFASFNYRLGPLGFFSTGNDSAPGNYGVWDQVQALKFLNAVLPAFGGNPNRITIFGSSAGGASISLLTYSSAAQGLFQKAMSMCGCSHAHWAQNNEISENSSMKILNQTNCLHHQNPKECFKNVSIDEIIAVGDVSIE